MIQFAIVALWAQVGLLFTWVYKLKMYSEMNNSASQDFCLACLQDTPDFCFCSQAQSDGNSISIRIISKENEFSEELINSYLCSTYGETRSQTPPQPPNDPPMEEEHEETQQNARRKTKDNIAHKRVSKIMQDVYRHFMGRKVSAELRKNYYKESYFIMLLTHLERQGKLPQVYDQFSRRMTLFDEKISQTYANQPAYLDYLRLLIQRHKEALELFSNDQLEASMKTLYDYDSMRQKHHFKKAYEEIFKLRASLGLPC